LQVVKMAEHTLLFDSSSSSISTISGAPLQPSQLTSQTEILDRTTRAGIREVVVALLLLIKVPKYLPL
jgi:hypothetical protein